MSLLCEGLDQHRMVKNFLHKQKNKDRGCLEIAIEVAKPFARRMHTARKVVKWEKEWMLPQSKVLCDSGFYEDQ